METDTYFVTVLLMAYRGSAGRISKRNALLGRGKWHLSDLRIVCCRIPEQWVAVPIVITLT